MNLSLFLLCTFLNFWQYECRLDAYQHADISKYSGVLLAEVEENCNIEQAADILKDLSVNDENFGEDQEEEVDKNDDDEDEDFIDEVALKDVEVNVNSDSELEVSGSHLIDTHEITSGCDYNSSLIVNT